MIIFSNPLNDALLLFFHRDEADNFKRKEMTPIFCGTIMPS
jgi:hypothetical protein